MTVTLTNYHFFNYDLMILNNNNNNNNSSPRSSAKEKGRIESVWLLSTMSRRVLLSAEQLLKQQNGTRFNKNTIKFKLKNKNLQ